MNAQTPPQPLQGVRVLDLTRLLPGAWCTQMLADLGAEVIKIEQPGSGDYWRWVEPHVAQQGYAFLALNRGKKSITLDLKHPDGRDAFLALCATADVVLEGFRPGVMDRLGLGAAELMQRHPRLVYCAITGFGQDGPQAQLAAHDLNYLGLTGVLHYVNGMRTSPRPTALPVADVGAGALMALPGILATLFESQKTGRGRIVDVSVADGLFAWVGFMTSQWNLRGRERAATPFDEPFDKPFYSVYETADGGHMVVGAYEPKFWRTLCEVLGLEAWIGRQWVAGEDEKRLRELLAQAFRRRTRAEWTEIFSRREACVTPVLTVQEALDGPQARARGTVVRVQDPVEGELEHIASPIRLDGVAPTSLEPCPRLGEHTEPLLQSVGYSRERIAQLRSAGAV